MLKWLIHRTGNFGTQRILWLLTAQTLVQQQIILHTIENGVGQHEPEPEDHLKSIRSDFEGEDLCEYTLHVIKQLVMVPGVQPAAQSMMCPVCNADARVSNPSSGCLEHPQCRVQAGRAMVLLH